MATENTAKEDLQKEQAYLARQQDRLETQKVALFNAQKNLEEARATGSSDAVIAAREREVQNQTDRLGRYQERVEKSQNQIDILSKQVEGQANPAGSEASTNAENAANAPTAEDAARRQSVAGAGPTEVSKTIVPSATVQTFDDGSSIQTFDDGSTLVTDTSGKITSTPANDGNLVTDPASKRLSAKADLDLAKINLQDKQEQSATAQADLAVKSQELDNAKSNLSLSQETSAQAQESLASRQSELAALQNDPYASEADIAAAQSSVDEAQANANAAATAVDDAQTNLDSAQSSYDNASEAAATAAQAVDDAQTGVDSAQSSYDNTAFSSQQNESPTNDDQSAAETKRLYEQGNRTPDSTEGAGQQNNEDSKFGRDTVSANGRNPSPVSARWAGVKDLRTTLRVPSTYLDGPFTGRLKQFSGILFPYTPQISYEASASYGSVSPTHSNFTQHFYKNSSVGSINLSGKFTVQNQSEAEIWLSIVHLGRALTKMRFGGEDFSGSPPPVCRLDSYGDYVLANVPVAVTSFKFELPDNVDYISVSKAPFGNSMAPTISTITFTLIPMYSRAEMRDYKVSEFLKGSFRGVGYL